jgi:hypothetical protein
MERFREHEKEFKMKQFSIKALTSAGRGGRDQDSDGSGDYGDENGDYGDEY